MHTELAILRRLLQYELRSAERYRRFVSIVMVGPGETITVDVERLLQETVRSSDELAGVEGAAAILMGETDSTGALAAVDRYKHRYMGAVDLRFAVATYPDDGNGVDSLLATAYRRFAMATAGDSGTVVTGD